ncbi:GNAT family N-acetyltransferase [Streptomyces sp. MBT58]|uniref:GNAT family N-acetyltransferase n=1 Tax=Streptomyces sp. MBT58 TaxID=1488389 RepID=UPI0019125300|nr:GNAT family N-acetyltransferase [Streptomyces sp. MBT58]MBK5995381.1 GNAT family N-acetyltransferase [Streptomyces sp. MBT58]
MTTDAPLPSPGREIQALDALDPAQADAVLELLGEAARFDGRQAVSEQGRLRIRGGHRVGVRHFLLTSDGTLAGYAQLEDTDPVEAPAAELVVHPDGQPLGGQVVQADRGQRLAAEGLPTVMLYVDADNTPAVTVYERMGFTTHEVDLMYRTES